MKQQKMKRKKKFRIKYIFLFILILIGAFYFSKHFFTQYTLQPRATNNNYSGIGQKTVTGKDGYTTTFTTADGKVYREYKQNGDSSWANRSYWSGTMSENGCGITCLATLASGYGMKFTPEDLRIKYAPNKDDHLSGTRISTELKNYFHLDNSDFCYSSQYLEKDYIFSWLKEDKPILICVWDKPDAKWTTSSHYLLLLATDNISKVYVSNPNGKNGTSRMSGWYDYKDVFPYIAKALFIES